MIELKSREGKYVISVGNRWGNEAEAAATALFFDPSEECSMTDKTLLNLSRSREIIEAHGGIVSARNDASNKMTWVDISLPE